MKKLFILLISATLGIVVSCNKEQLEPTSELGTGELTEVHLSLKASPMKVQGSDAATKTVTTDNLVVTYGADPDSKIMGGGITTALAGEDIVKDINVIQFNAEGTRIGGGHVTTAEIQTDGSYKIPASLVVGDSKIYVIANHGIDISGTTTETALLALSPTIPVGGYIPSASEGLPMMGVYVGEVKAGYDIGIIPMDRLVAKIVFKYKVDEAFLPLVSDFTIGNATLRNVAKKASYIEEPVVGGSSNYPVNSTASHHSTYGTTTGSGGLTTTAEKEIVWYVPENLRGINTSIEDLKNRTNDMLVGNQKNATYAEITGVVDSKKMKGDVSFTFLLGNVLPNVGGDNGNFNVERNTVYTVSATIKGLSKSDHRIEVDQTAGGDMSNSAIVAPGGNVAFNLRKIYEGNPTSMDLDAFAGLTTELLWQDNPDLRLTHNTTTAGKLTVAVTNVANQHGNAIIAVKKGSEILWSWHIWVTDYNPAFPSVALGKNAVFKVRGNGSATGGEVHTYGAGYMTLNPGKVIMDRDLGAKTAYNTAATPKADAANAVDAWGLLYQFGRKDPFSRGHMAAETGAVSEIDIYNAIGGTIDRTDAIDGRTSISESIKNPAAFIKGSFIQNDETKTGDWVTPQNDDLWGHESGRKSPYDPCPKGWRVPKNGTWADFVDDGIADASTAVGSKNTFDYRANNKEWEGGKGDPPAYTGSTNVTARSHGRQYAAGVIKTWFPASGQRHLNSGRLSNVGYQGLPWSSSVSGTFGFHMHFHTTNLNTSLPNFRALGFPVRCLQE